VGENSVREQFNIVVVGHVDHGKSTVIGRLLADTGSLPDGKLEQVQRECARTSKPFEYAFLLDALKAEQAQGITIDTARSFFKSEKRDYIIIDAPGHIEFLKNMITGAARAEAALLIIDAKEGVRENSRRHGTLLSLLGIKQVVVGVNKMDLVDYSQSVFETIQKEYTAFLAQVGLHPQAFLPLAAFHGENLITPSARMPWFQQAPLLAQMDRFVKEVRPDAQDLRLPVQDVYKFTEAGDDRRIVAGRIEAGTLNVQDEVVFYPSHKKARVKTFEEFNVQPPQSYGPGKSVGFTLDPEIYVQPGELMVRSGQKPPHTGTRLRGNVFWMGRKPLIVGKKYKLKLHTGEVPVWVEEIRSVLDASDLSSSQKNQVDQHEVGECILETFKPVAFDLSSDLAPTGRFVIVDDYEIAGGGIILEDLGKEQKLLERHLENRERQWDRSHITVGLRSGRYGQRQTFLLLTGEANSGNQLSVLGRALEEKLFSSNRFVYYLGLSSALSGIYADQSGLDDRWEVLRRLGEVAHLFTDAGVIFITAVPGLDEAELQLLETLAKPADVLVVNLRDRTDEEATRKDLYLTPQQSLEEKVRAMTNHLFETNVLLDWVL
jgi:bifunctional enzyme CysN/CysC